MIFEIKVLSLVIFYVLLLRVAKMFYFEPERFRKAAPRRAKLVPVAYSDGMLRFLAYCAVIITAVSSYIFLRFGIPN